MLNNFDAREVFDLVLTVLNALGLHLLPTIVCFCPLLKIILLFLLNERL